MRSPCRAGDLARALGLGLCLLVALSGPLSARTGFSFSIGGRQDLGDLWNADDLQTALTKFGKAREAWFQAQDKAGAFLLPPAVDKIPHWATCQDIALQERVEMLLIRMNRAGVKAAIAMLKGDMHWEYEDQLGRDLPFSFDAESRGSEILMDFRLAGCSPSQKLRVLRQADNRLRELFTEWRDAIRRDTVMAHHSVEAADRGQDPAKKAKARWRLLFELGRLVPQAEKPARRR